MPDTKKRKLVALHHQIYLTLRNELIRGHYSTNDDSNPSPLPGEKELAEQYGVSRMTVRQALAALEREGLIVRRHGSGTFAVPLGTHLRRSRDVESVYDEVTDLIHGYEQEILAFERTRTPPFVANHCPDFGPECLHLSVLSKSEGKPVHLNFQYIPGRLAHLLGHRPPSDVSLLLLLRRKGVRSDSIELNLSATAADLATARRLDVHVGLPLIATRRLSRDAAGATIEFFEAVTRPDRYSYTFQFSGTGPRDRKALSRKS